MKSLRKVFVLLSVGLGLGGGYYLLDQQGDQGAVDPSRMVGTMGVQISQEMALPVVPSRERSWVQVLGNPRDPAAITVSSDAPDRVVLEFKMPGFFLQNVDIAGTACSRVGVPGLTRRQSAGLPEVPALAASLTVPGDGKTSFKIIEQTTRRYLVRPVEPSVGHVMRNVDPATVVPVFDDFYSEGGTWPKQAVELSPSFILSGTTGVNVRINPLRYDADKSMLEVVEHLVVEVVTTGGASKSMAAQDLNPAQELVCKRTFANWQSSAPAAADKYERLQTAGRLLIVADDAFVGHLAEFAQWKRQRGLDVSLVPISQLGGTAAGISQHIAQMYAEPAGLTWVILVGDKAQVPTNAGQYDGSDSDTRFALVDGDDLYPDLFVSRFSASNSTDLLTQVNRSLRYEKQPSLGTAGDWYRQGLGVASDEGTPSDDRRADMLRDDLLNYGFQTVTSVYQGAGGTALDIAESLGKGASVVNYLGHGSGYGWTSVPFDVSDVGNLTNTQAWPWIIDVACSNGDFALAECFAEAWLRAGTPDDPTGAVAMIAASSLAPWTPPTLMQAEAIDLMVGEEETTIGGLFYSGLMQVLDAYAGLDVAQQVLEQNVIFGDCTLQVRTAAPQEFVVSDLPLIHAGIDAWTVQATGPAGSVVAVTSPGVLHGRGVLDASGTAQVSIFSPVAELETLTVTITGFNMAPHWETVTVAEAVTTVGEQEEQPQIPDTPDHVELLGNYPNPFNPSTTIAFELPGDMRVQLTVYDVRGNLVQTLLNESLPAGRREVEWNGRDRSGRTVASGVYLYRLQTPEGDQTGRMLLSK